MLASKFGSSAKEIAVATDLHQIKLQYIAIYPVYKQQIRLDVTLSKLRISAF